ncbi:MAG TPA: alpha-galactosidase [Terriglobia bacterium]|jgi:alpha-galactosidase|nr:alpha-galactosidase [Terriglobia bacterium]
MLGSTFSKMGASLLMMSALAGPATVPQSDTSANTDARQWVAAKFAGQAPVGVKQGFLIVQRASGTVLKNGIKGHTLRIASTPYQRGINASEGTVTVHLPGPGKSLTAVVGVDSNDVGYYSNAGRGSVVASVEIAGKQAFASALLHEGMEGVPLEVDLGGATEFTLKVKRVEARKPWDDPEWDQADWANSRIDLQDGSTIWLADLPIGPLPGPYTLDPPFSFRYGGEWSADLLKTWKLTRSERSLDADRTEYTLLYRDPKTGLSARCVAVAYHDFPTVEWTLSFKNDGSSDSPILEQIQALDTGFERSAEGEFLLHHSKGSAASPTDYEPLETPLQPKADERITTTGGRPTNSDLCYFNVEWPGRGVIIALGWPGQWAAEFRRDEGRRVRVQAGQELTHFKLLPGEEVRSPLVALQFWRGDWIGAQNTWRRWMIAHNLPRPGGKLPPPQAAASSGRFTIEMQEANEANQKHFIDAYLESGFHFDYWWMDAGWYIFKSHWYATGTWEVDPERFPHGLWAVSDYAHQKNLKTIVWFEPERVAPGSWLYENRPQWLLGTEGKDKLLYLGNPEAWHWLVEHVDGLIKDQGIDLYRQDFNFDPLGIWRSNDAPDRQGITEIRHVTGYLAYWDELRRRHPDMLIDTCASGGRRNDLETLRRAVPLWRSDYPYEPTAMQDQTYGMALWIPYFGTAVNSDDPYAFRSQMVPAVGVGVEPGSKEIDYSRYLRLLAQWRAVSNDYYGDYYPLTPYAPANDVWLAWQFDRPDVGEGMVQAFRRPQSPFESARLKLRGLDPDAHYTVRDLDQPQGREMDGRELTEGGLLVSIRERPGAVMITYKRN